MDPHIFLNLKNLFSNTDKLIKLSGGSIAPVLKANAYGHGACLAAKYLEEKFEIEQIPFFCVARFQEAIELRRNNIKKAILVLSHFTKKNLEEDLGVESKEILLTIKDYNAWCLVKEQSKPFKIHLKINTGMNRMGVNCLNTDEINKIITEIQTSNHTLVGIMSHFSSADGDSKFTNIQLTNFKATIDHIQDFFLENNWDFDEIKYFHISNSSGICSLQNSKSYNESLLNLTRPGILLWGVFPSMDEFRKYKTYGFKQVLKIVAPVVQILNVKKGQCTGYGNTSLFKKDGKIAILPVGYADGLPRLENLRFIANNKEYFSVGKVSMDTVAIDLGNELEIDYQSKFIFFNNPEEIYQYSTLRNTITYDLLCSLGQRLAIKCS